jgi:hypothetical protein
MKCLVWKFHTVKQAFKQKLVWETRLFVRIFRGIRWSDPNVLLSGIRWSDPNVALTLMPHSYSMMEAL